MWKDSQICPNLESQIVISSFKVAFCDLRILKLGPRLFPLSFKVANCDFKERGSIFFNTRRNQRIRRNNFLFFCITHRKSYGTHAHKLSLAQCSSSLRVPVRGYKKKSKFPARGKYIKTHPKQSCRTWCGTSFYIIFLFDIALDRIIQSDRKFWVFALIS